MKSILVLLAASVALLSGCIVAPDRDEHRGGGYYGAESRADHDHDREHDRGHDDHDRGDHRDDGGDRDRWQGGPRY